MAKKCSTNATKIAEQVDGSRKPNYTYEYDKTTGEVRYEDPMTQAMMNRLKEQDKNPQVFDGKISLVDNIKKLMTYIKTEFVNIKENKLNKPFKGVKDGVDGATIYLTSLREKILTYFNSLNATHEQAVSAIYNDFMYTVYDENGDPVLDKNGDPVKKQLSNEKVHIVSSYIFEKQLLEMFEDNKKVYFRDRFIDMLENPQNYNIPQETAELWLESIQESNELYVDKFTKIALTNEAERRLRVYAKENDMEVKDLPEEVINQVYEDVEATFDLTEKQKAAILKDAANNNKDTHYIDWIKNDVLPVLEDIVQNDSELSEVYENLNSSREDLRGQVELSFNEIGVDISHMFKKSDYFKIIIDEVQDQINKGVQNPTVFGVSFKNVLGQKGFYGEVLTNFKNAEYIFRVNMLQNIKKAELIKEMDRHNIATHISDEITSIITNVNEEFKERLLNGNITDGESKKLISSIKLFNEKFATRYPNLEIMYDESNLTGNREFKDNNNEVKEGSLFDEINNNITLAEQSILNKLKARVQNGDLDSYFESQSSLKDVQAYLEGKTDNIPKERLNVFYKKIYTSVNPEHKFSEAILLNDLQDIAKDLQDKVLIDSNFSIKQILKPYLFDEKGNERYVLTNDMGLRIDEGLQQKLSSIWFHDFDKDNGAKFAEFMQQTFLLDNSQNGNVLKDILKDKRIRILPAPIAEVMESLQIKSDKKISDGFFGVLTKATGISKLGMLFSPFQIATYNFRNMISDTYFMFQSSPSSLKSLADKELWTDLGNYFTGGAYSDTFNFFLENTESFYGLNFNEVFESLNQADKDKFSNLKNILEEVDVSNPFVSKFAKGYKVLEYFGKKYLNAGTHISQTREFFLRYATFKNVRQQLMNSLKNGEVSLKSYGASKRSIMDNFMKEIKEENNSERKAALINQMAVTYANQILVSYKDASNAVDSVSKFAIPFARFVEGNVRLHYRLFQNHIYDYIDALKKDSIGQKIKGVGKTAAKGAYQTSMAMGVPTLIWNAVALALAGLDEDDIPKYYEENGYTVLPPFRRLFGMEGAVFVGNTNVFSDMLSLVGLDKLNASLGRAVTDNLIALTDEDLEFDIVGDLRDAIASSLSDVTPTTMTQDGILKLISMMNPFVKSPFEIGMGADVYPEQVVDIRERYGFWENVSRKALQTLGLQKLFSVMEEAFGTPRGMDFLETFGFKTAGSKVDAYNIQRARAYEYAEEVLGKEFSAMDSEWDDQKRLLRDDIKNSLMYGDHERAYKKFREYEQWISENSENEEEYMKHWENLRTSLRNSFDVIPNRAISNEQLEEYVMSLTSEEYEELLLAYEYQREILGVYYDWIYSD